MRWTEHAVETLKRMWDNGASAAEVANAVGGVTRNAVLGKVFRLGLAVPSEKLKEAAAANAARQKSGQAEARRARKLPIFGPVALKEEPFEPASVEVSTEYNCTLMSLRNSSCRYAVTERSPHIFCGIPEADLSKKRPYCRAHAAIAYGGKRERHRTQQRQFRSDQVHSRAD